MFQRNIGHQGVNRQFPVPDLPLEPFGFHRLFINSIEESEQRSTQLGYISSFNTCSHVKSSLMHNPDPPKMMHERYFYVGTCLEGDSAHPLSWMARRVTSYQSSAHLHACIFISKQPPSSDDSALSYLLVNNNRHPE